MKAEIRRALAMLVPFGPDRAKGIVSAALAKLTTEERASLELVFRHEEEAYAELLVRVIREQLLRELPATIRGMRKRPCRNR